MSPPSLTQRTLHCIWYGKNEDPSLPGQVPLYRTRPALLDLLGKCPARGARKARTKDDYGELLLSLLNKKYLLSKTYSFGSSPATCTTIQLFWPSYRPKVKRSNPVPSSRKRPRSSEDSTVIGPTRKLARKPPITGRGLKGGGGLGLRKPFQPPLRSSSKPSGGPTTSPRTLTTTPTPSLETTRLRREALEKRLQQAKDTLRARDILQSDGKSPKSLKYLQEKWKRVAQEAAERLRSRVDPSMLSSLGRSTGLSKVPLGWMLRHLGIEDTSLLGYNPEDDVFYDG
ncbi:MAG: hypothetical protein DHS80DRAFT_28318 [Piptocephalis tieghemiana]|nr:MAG: hypothetical protein DHS80DRAFT_28318 [Piptocephalis tieghemiana]